MLVVLALTAGGALVPGALGANEPDFRVTTFPVSATVLQGESLGLSVTVLGEHSYDGPPAVVTLASAPTGVTGSCSPNPVPEDRSCALTLSVLPSVEPGTYQLTVEGDNGSAVRSATFSLTIYPAASVEIVLDATTIQLLPGESGTVTATVGLSGPPGVVANLSTTLVSGSGVDVTIAPASLSANGTALLTFEANSSASTRDVGVTVSARVMDATASAPLTVQIRGPGAGGSETPAWWLLPLILVGVAGAGLSAALVVSRRRRGGGGAPWQAAEREVYLIEDVFLLYRDGRTLFRRTGLGGDPTPDPEIVGSMLVAIQDFVRDAFSRGAAVDRMSYGEDAVMLERGEHVILAITVFGRTGEDLRESMREAIGAFEARYAGVIENWDGGRQAFAGAEEVLKALWAPTAGLSRADVRHALTTKEVQVLSGVEFFQGFVRLKVAVANNTESEVQRVSVEIDHNGDVLRLHRVEPATLRRSGSKVLLGSVKPGDRVTVAFYFDPQICTSSALEGVCRFTLADGTAGESRMKPRRAEVVCPLFFTPGQANTASLRRLVETELLEYDVRAFQLPAAMSNQDLQDTFEALKAAVAAHDVLEVRSHESSGPYAADAWFYGRTQHGQDMVIRAAVSQSSGRGEFYVAARSMRAVTGLLAELSHTLRRSTSKQVAGPVIESVYDESMREPYRDRHFVSRLIEGEIEAGETSS